MPVPPTLSVNAVISDGARAELTSIGGDAVTIHPSGRLCQPSLHWGTLEQLEAWHEDLGDKIIAERLHRLDARQALDEMDATLRRAGAR